MRDALGFCQSGLALSQVAKHQQRGQGVGQPSPDLLEEALLLGRPDPRVRALVQPEQIRSISLRVDGYCNLGAYAETRRRLCGQRMLRTWTEQARCKPLRL